MCTSASMHWLMAQLLHQQSDFSDSTQIDKVMRWAVQQYEVLAQSMPAYTRMLSHQDVLADRPLPPCLSSEAMSGHYLELNEEEQKLFGSVVHMHELHDRLSPNSGCLVTAAGHTVAVHCDANGKLCLFDSLPAVERRVLPDNLSSALQDSLGNTRPFQECDITLIKHTHPAAPKRARGPSQQ